jgi:phosphatidate cytidylyltransferase
MKRFLPGILLAIGWLLLLTKGSFLVFWAVVLLIGIIGAREYCRMSFPDILYEGDRTILSIILSLPILASAFSQNTAYPGALGVLLGFAALIIYVLYNYSRFDSPMSLLSRGVLGIVFVGFLASHLVLVRSLPDGANWLIILTAITAGSDTLAYYVGSRWGRRKLCPHISPNKTIEGALGGIAGGMAAALVLSLFFSVSAGFPVILLLALVLSVVGMLGDLLESVIKRGTGIKDSGSLLGGHGGVLDRVDSLLLAAPVLYYILLYSGF